MTSLQKWMLTSVAILALGTATLGFLAFERGTGPTLESAIIGTLILAPTAIGAPARIFGPQIREVRTAKKKRLRDTFK